MTATYTIPAAALKSTIVALYEGCEWNERFTAQIVAELLADSLTKQECLEMVEDVLYHHKRDVDAYYDDMFHEHEYMQSLQEAEYA
jgi:hypothetical protein